MKKQLLFLSLFSIFVVNAAEQSLFNKAFATAKNIVSHPATKIGVGAVLIASVAHRQFRNNTDVVAKHKALPSHLRDKKLSGMAKADKVAVLATYDISMLGALGAGIYLVVDGITDLVKSDKNEEKKA